MTRDLTLAAGLGMLGFPIRVEVVVDDPERRSGQELRQFHIGPLSATTGLERGVLVRAFMSGELEREDPLHPLLQVVRARACYGAILDAQNRGRRIRLVGTPGSYASVYTDGQELPRLVVQEECIETDDLALAAALGTVGIPVIRITGSGRHVYTLPNRGHLLRRWPDDEAVPMVQHVAALLARRQPGSKYELALAAEDPLHPLVSAYHGLDACAQLKRALAHAPRAVMLRPPGTCRTALVGLNAEGRVMDRVMRHFKVPG